ncbi:uncharacterized protein BJ212DRAFT_1298683 [Suillus subaureus]|uniref:Uncharacterized protein n=1 Tax=Suillus subaureus TaxID=48587 RepID=A0A9P7JEZ1_9AGAM|nr:uncharacterized protein BJ212DRAFT_1298683 [Suillus subaureus]KAG1818613.1 hypothetical protein BJ212DRAFT_1298683 [Suillus subaureus]
MCPALPLEIQQKIIALAMHDRETTAENLRVSKQIYPWLERLMYKMIILYHEETVKQFLDYGSPLWHALNALPLKSLLLSVEIDFTSSSGKLNVFQNLTHFNITNDCMLNKPNVALEGLVSLMHLCVVLILGRSDPLAVIHLVSNSHLQLLAFRMKDVHHRVKWFLDEHEVIDHWIVFLPMELGNWAQLGQGDMLIWELAEEQVKLPIPESSESFTSSISSGLA